METEIEFFKSNQAVDQKHESFKEEILREMATVSNQSQFMIGESDEGGGGGGGNRVVKKAQEEEEVTNIQGTDVTTQDNVFLYTVVRDEIDQEKIH